MRRRIAARDGSEAKDGFEKRKAIGAPGCASITGKAAFAGIAAIKYRLNNYGINNYSSTHT